MILKAFTTFLIFVLSNYAVAQTSFIFKSSFEFVSRLNDTGITFGGDDLSRNNNTCTSNISSPQDCHHGRDATNDDDSDGSAGFSFTKLDTDGNPLADQSVDYTTTPWSCVRDNVTDLIWETKTDDGGIHDIDDEYSSYNTDSTINGGFDGYADNNGPICYGYNASDSSTFCNTQAFTARVNTQGLCGKNDWRMPNTNELFSIIDLSKYNPTVDINYFPNTKSRAFWSYSPYARDSSYAWFMHFYSGRLGANQRFSGVHIRLVRDRQ